jgi:hypothetical protein
LAFFSLTFSILFAKMEAAVNDIDSKDSTLSGWTIVHTTSDLWEAKLLRTAVLAERIRCELRFRKKDRKDHIEILVPEERKEEAEFVINRAIIVISDHSRPASKSNKIEASLPPTKSSQLKAEQAEQARQAGSEEFRLPQSSPTAIRRVIMAQRQGIGEIVHFEGRGYELRVGPEPHYMVAEARWEEFTDFSAQRQEFAILLKGEYPRLFKWLKEEKQMAEFIKLVESTYREVPPPKPKKLKAKPSAIPVSQVGTTPASPLLKKICWPANVSILLAMVAVVALVLGFHIYFKYSASILALAFGLIAKYQIIQQEGRFKGNRLATIGIMVSSIVLAITLAQG